MDVAARLAAKRRQQEKARKQAEAAMEMQRPMHGDRAMKEFADGLDRIAPDREGMPTTWERFKMRQADVTANKESGRAWASRWQDTNVCNRCGGYGYANVHGASQALEYCFDCGHWDAVIEDGVRKYNSDADYRKRVKARSKENPIAARILKEGGRDEPKKGRREPSGYGDL